MKHKFQLICLVLIGLVSFSISGYCEDEPTIKWSAEEGLRIAASGGPEMGVVSNLNSLIFTKDGTLQHDVHSGIVASGVNKVIMDSFASLTFEDGGIIYNTGYKVSDTLTLPQSQEFSVFMDHIYSANHNFKSQDPLNEPTSSSGLILVVPEMGIDIYKWDRDPGGLLTDAEMEKMIEKYKNSRFLDLGATHEMNIDIPLKISNNGVSCTIGQSMGIKIGIGESI